MGFNCASEHNAVIDLPFLKVVVTKGMKKPFDRPNTEIESERREGPTMVGPFVRPRSAHMVGPLIQRG